MLKRSVLLIKPATAHTYLGFQYPAGGFSAPAGKSTVTAATGCSLRSGLRQMPDTS